jgi:hypothetical protein
MGSGGIARSFLTSAIEGGKWSASRLGRFTSQELISPVPMDWKPGGPQSRSGRCAEEEISCLYWNRTQSSSTYRVTYRLSYPGPIKACRAGTWINEPVSVSVRDSAAFEWQCYGFKNRRTGRRGVVVGGSGGDNCGFSLMWELFWAHAARTWNGIFILEVNELQFVTVMETGSHSGACGEFWGLMPHSPVKFYPHFEGAYRLHLYEGRVSRETD